MSRAVHLHKKTPAQYTRIVNIKKEEQKNRIYLNQKKKESYLLTPKKKNYTKKSYLVYEKIRSVHPGVIR